MRKGTEIIAKLPDGYDDRTRMRVFEGSIIVVHPEMPPLVVRPDGTVEELKPAGGEVVQYQDRFWIRGEAA